MEKYRIVDEKTLGDDCYQKLMAISDVTFKETSLFSSEFYYKTHLVIFSRTAKFTSLFFVGLTVCWTGTGIPKKSVVGRNDGKGPSDHDAEPLERLVFNAILL